VDQYAVRQRRCGPWDWSRALRQQAGFCDHAGEEVIRKRLAEDPWMVNAMLTVASIERWTILLDGRS
jgi:hypothetical protein